MEQFLLDSVPRYQSLVRAFKPPRLNKAAASTNSSNNITVAARIRPMLEDEIASGQVAGVFARKGSDGLVDIHELRKKVRGPPILNSFSFTVDKVFGPDRTTEMIYEDIVQPLVPWVCKGNVGTLFAYGQTGSGKTHTVSGLERLIAKSLFDNSSQENPEVHVCIFELAGNSAYDLLSARQSFSILEDSFGDTQLVGVQDIHVTSAAELLELIDRASSFRHTASTEKNDGSSRSHAICRIRVKNPSPDSLDDGILYLVDLAGSEIARDVASHTANRMKETREINISLSVLKDCIRERATLDSVLATERPSSSSSKKPYIPFRRSALTKVLKHLFDPADDNLCAKTIVLGCINPSFLDVAASKNTLRYAEMLRVVAPKPKQVEFDPDMPTTWTNKDMRKYIEAESGIPTISPAILAPHETGLQLLRLPAADFIHRCLQTDGVTDDQAKAFHSKLWDLHIRSQHSTAPADSSLKDGKFSDDKNQNLWPEKLTSSRDPDSSAQLLPFKERIRPGMVVRWNPPADFALQFPGKHNLAVILCPQQAVGGTVRDFLGKEVRSNGGGQRYLCAMVLPGKLADAYEVSLWQQVVVDVDEMEAEVLLQYDTSTRYYHSTV